MKGDETQLLRALSAILVTRRWHDDATGVRLGGLLLERLNGRAAFVFDTHTRLVRDVATGRAAAGERVEAMRKQLVAPGEWTARRLSENVLAVCVDRRQVVAVELADTTGVEAAEQLLRPLIGVLPFRGEGPAHQIAQIVSELQHHVNNALAVAIGGVEFVKRNVPGADEHDELTAALYGLHRIPRMLRAIQVASASTPMAGRGPAFVGDVLQTAVRAADRVTVDLDVRSLSADEIAIEPRPMCTILVALLENALESTQSDSVRLRVRREALRTPACATVVFEVIDTGLGPAEPDRVFEPFYTTRGPRRMGLGLTGARSLARAVGGDVTYAGHQGSRTTFRASVPRYRRDA